MIKGARPVVDQEIKTHYNNFVYSPATLEQYSTAWNHWLTKSQNKSLGGIETFTQAEYVCGTSQAFDHFCLRNHSRRLICFAGEFQYHACLGKFLNFSIIKTYKEILPGDALVISLPFSDYGYTHPEFNLILQKCNELSIPVCLDLAYWGIAKNINLDLNLYPCIVDIACSLSKPFYVLENHRVGIRFSRQYHNDGVNMLNEVNMQNLFSMRLGIYFMQNFSADWAWTKYNNQYLEVCDYHGVDTTDTVIFALSSDNRYKEFNRGIPKNYRLCISKFLSDC